MSVWEAGTTDNLAHRTADAESVKLTCPKISAEVPTYTKVSPTGSYLETSKYQVAPAV